MPVRVIPILLILVEADHLIEDLLRDGIDGGELEWSDSHLHVGKAPDYWLHLRIVDSVKRLDHHQVVLLLLIFHDCSLHGSEVLLVR